MAPNSNKSLTPHKALDDPSFIPVDNEWEYVHAPKERTGSDDEFVLQCPTDEAYEGNRKRYQSRPLPTNKAERLGYLVASAPSLVTGGYATTATTAKAAATIITETANTYLESGAVGVAIGTAGVAFEMARGLLGAGSYVRGSYYGGADVARSERRRRDGSFYYLEEGGSTTSSEESGLGSGREKLLEGKSGGGSRVLGRLEDVQVPVGLGIDLHPQCESGSHQKSESGRSTPEDERGRPLVGIRRASNTAKRERSNTDVGKGVRRDSNEGHEKHAVVERSANVRSRSKPAWLDIENEVLEDVDV